MLLNAVTEIGKLGALVHDLHVACFIFNLSLAYCCDTAFLLLLCTEIS